MRGVWVLLVAGCSYNPPRATDDASPLPPDSAVTVDMAVDMAVDDPLCFGTGVAEVCLAALPVAPLVFAIGTTINTGTSTTCVATTNPAADAYCVLSGIGITINQFVQLRGTGARPLVLVSTTTITVDGTIEVASHGTGVVGAGANAACMDGTPATEGTSSGGGFGGSFGGLGATGESNDGGAGGIAPPVVTTITALRGGCRGGDGGPISNTKGPGGNSGGAIALLADGSITISGTINASGTGGRQAGFVKQGAGGGGSGGMIVLDAPTITATGSIFANGGGGGEGNSSVGGGSAGQPGGDPNSPTGAGPGGDGFTTSGGDGGDGSVGGPGGAPPGNADPNGGGGGGGGGGCGVVRSTQPLTNATVSPAPS